MKIDELKQIIREEIQQFLFNSNFNLENIQSETALRELELLNELKYNLDDIYPITAETNLSYEFKDDQGRLNITRGVDNNGYIEIKLFWIDEDGNLSMESPTKVSRKTMNTHLSNIINKLLPRFNKFLFRPNDSIRFRLFVLLLNKFLDKTIWDLIIYQNIIIITKK